MHPFVGLSTGASSFAWFMAGRVLQGLAASGCLVVILASARDCYDDPAERAQAIATMISGTLMGPILAPFFGGLLGSAFGWRFPFALLAAAAALLAYVSCIVTTETAKEASVNADGHPASASVAWSRRILQSLNMLKCL